MDESGAGPEDVKGIGLSGQMHGLVMLDEKGEVIRRSKVVTTPSPTLSFRDT